MAPKNKGKKGKKNDDDYWSVCRQSNRVSLFIIYSREKAGEAVESSMTTSMNISDTEGSSLQKLQNGFSAFSALTDQDTAVFEDDGDGGGLMAREIMSIGPLDVLISIDSLS